MAKIGRNDPCPCGSGKKYKHCCLNKARQQTKVLDWPWPNPAVPENFVLGELLGSSPEFEAYYRAERAKILKELYWVKDSSLPEGIDYRSTLVSTGQRVIRLRRIPAVLTDALKIAHELQHCVVDMLGFPSTGSRAEYETLSSSLNSMVHDPIVNSCLLPYGFDLWNDYEAECKENRRQLEKIPAAPSNRLDRVHWMINYVGNVLEWRVARGQRDDNEFRTWFDAKYPDLASEARELLDLVDSVGYDTPSKMADFFKSVIEKYRLRHYIVLNS